MGDIENVKLCKLLLQTNDSTCVEKLVDRQAGAINVTYCNTEDFNDPLIDFDQFKYFEQEYDNGTVVCKLWEKPNYSSSSIILPVIVFALLCLLLFIMVYQNL
jgi:hypothetical protein